MAKNNIVLYDIINKMEETYANRYRKAKNATSPINTHEYQYSGICTKKNINTVTNNSNPTITGANSK